MLSVCVAKHNLEVSVYDHIFRIKKEPKDEDKGRSGDADVTEREPSVTEGKLQTLTFYFVGMVYN